MQFSEKTYLINSIFSFVFSSVSSSVKIVDNVLNICLISFLYKLNKLTLKKSVCLRKRIIFSRILQKEFIISLHL